jgi:hypothetical protein
MASDGFRPIPWLPGAFAGLDRKPPPENLNWFEKLMHLSNFTFFNHYLTHSFKGGFGYPIKIRVGNRIVEVPPKQPSKEAFPTLLKQEWGIWFIYLAIPQQDRLKNPDGANAKEWKIVSSKSKDERPAAAWQLGTEHAKLLKQKFLLPLGPEAQGAIVYVDFEDFYELGQLQPETISYYNGIFAELRILGSENLALRPGLYAQTPSTADIIASREENTDLFLWEVDWNDIRAPAGSAWSKDYNTALGMPFYERAGRIYSAIEYHPLKGFTHNDYNGNPDKVKRTGLLIGRQWLNYKNKPMPKPDKEIPLNSESNWDFNVSMVRDPRYPITLPQIVAFDDIVLRSVFEIPVLEKDRQRLPITRLEQVQATSITKLPYTETKDGMFEHEAPLLLLSLVKNTADKGSKEAVNQEDSKDNDVPGVGSEVFTLNKSGKIVLITASLQRNHPGTWDWSSPISIQDDAPELRRNRAMTGTKLSVTGKLETQIFYVTSQHMLLGLRRTDTKDWTANIMASFDIPVHPFSNITAVSRQDSKDPKVQVTEIFFLNNAGCLCVATCSTSQWPRSEVKELETKRTLLHGTSMVTVSPSKDETLFFGIGINCSLYVARRRGPEWSPVTKIENEAVLKKTDDRLFPHAKMDIFFKSPNLVCVATITAANIPCMYILEYSDYELRDVQVKPEERTDSGREQYVVNIDDWKLTSRKYFPNNLRKVMEIDPRVKFQPAPGLPNDYNDKVLQDNGKRNVSVGYAFNPFGSIKLSMIGPNLTMWIAGVTMAATLGYSSDRSVLLFIKALLPDEAYRNNSEYWRRVT